MGALPPSTPAPFCGVLGKAGATGRWRSSEKYARASRVGASFLSVPRSFVAVRMLASAGVAFVDGASARRTRSRAQPGVPSRSSRGDRGKTQTCAHPPKALLELRVLRVLRMSCGFRTRSKRLPFLRHSGNWRRCVHLLHCICSALPSAFPPTLCVPAVYPPRTAGSDQRRGGILIPAGRYATSAPRERAPRGAAKAQLPDYSASQLWVPLPIHTLCRFAWPCTGHGNAREASWTPLPLQSLNRSWRARARAPART
jgi:hypothetical protein